MKKVIIDFEDSISILYMNENSSIEAEIDKWHAFDKSRVIQYVELEDNAVLPDRHYRRAWCLMGDKKIGIKSDIAQADALERLRVQRNEALVKFDVPFLQALETDNTERLNYLKVQKQILRDKTEPLKALVLSQFLDSDEINQLKKMEKLS